MIRTKLTMGLISLIGALAPLASAQAEDKFPCVCTCGGSTVEAKLTYVENGEKKTASSCAALTGKDCGSGNYSGCKDNKSTSSSS